MRNFEGSAAAKPPRPGKEKPANTALQKLRAEVLAELFGGNEDVFELAFTAAAEVERHRFNERNISNGEDREPFIDALIGILLGWQEQFAADQEVFIDAVMRLIES